MGVVMRRLICIALSFPVLALAQPISAQDAAVVPTAGSPDAGVADAGARDAGGERDAGTDATVPDAGVMPLDARIAAEAGPGEPLIGPTTDGGISDAGAIDGGMSAQTADRTTDAGILEELPGRPGVALLVALLVFAVVASVGLRRLREALPDKGVIPRAVGASRFLLRLVAFGIVLVLGWRAARPWLGTPIVWVLLAVVVVAAWSARDLLADLVAWLVVTSERRVRPGIWLSGNGFSGLVESRGLRAVWLRDGLGHRIAVPNRMLLGGPVVSQVTAGPVHDVTLRMAPRGRPSAAIRQALRDAVLTSPWVRPDTSTVVRRDGTDPQVWHIRARLLDVRHAIRFEGDLLERAEEFLGGTEPARPSSATGREPELPF